MPVTKLFIGSSTAAKSQAKKLVEELSSPTVEFTTWWDAITPGQLLLDELEKIKGSVDGALLVFSPESESTIRGDIKQLPNLNVLFEFGYFFGGFERKKVAMIRYGDYYLPSDFGGYQWIHGSKGFRRAGVQAIIPSRTNKVTSLRPSDSRRHVKNKTATWQARCGCRH